MTSEAEGKAKIERLKDRIDTGAKFDEQAQAQFRGRVVGQGRRSRLA